MRGAIITVLVLILFIFSLIVVTGQGNSPLALIAELFDKTDDLQDQIDDIPTSNLETLHVFDGDDQDLGQFIQFLPPGRSGGPNSVLIFNKDLKLFVGIHENITTEEVFINHRLETWYLQSNCIGQPYIHIKSFNHTSVNSLFTTFDNIPINLDNVGTLQNFTFNSELIPQGCHNFFRSRTNSEFTELIEKNIPFNLPLKFPTRIEF